MYFNVLSDSYLILIIFVVKSHLFDRTKQIMSDTKTKISFKTYFIMISANNLIYDYLVVIVVPYKGG